MVRGFVSPVLFTGLGTYGKINNEGSVTETIGNISVTENGYEYESIN